VLGLLDVKTAVYEPKWDLADGCRFGATSRIRERAFP
jgi:hypothetical protein